MEEGTFELEEGTFELGHREESNPPSGMSWGGEIFRTEQRAQRDTQRRGQEHESI